MNSEKKCIKIMNFFKKIIGIIIGTVAFCIMLFKLKITFIGIENKSDILSNIINFIAISTGFLMTTLSILAAANNSRVMRKLAKYKKIKQLNIFFIEPIVVSIILIITCIVEIGLTETTIIENTLAAGIVGLFINFIFDFFRIGYICVNILEEMMEENFRDNKKEKVIQPNTDKVFAKKI